MAEVDIELPCRECGTSLSDCSWGRVYGRGSYCCAGCSSDPSDSYHDPPDEHRSEIIHLLYPKENDA